MSSAATAANAATRLVLFDLDGTLVDTAEDLAAAVNQCQARRGLTLTPLHELRPWTSHGARGLIGRAFGIEPADAGYEELRAEFLDHYEQALCVHSRLYDGIEQTLAAIEASNRRWGVVTNKPARFTGPLLRALGLEGRAACVVSGDTTARPKPTWSYAGPWICCAGSCPRRHVESGLGITALRQSGTARRSQPGRNCCP